MTINFKLLTIFPELFPGPLGFSLAGKALNNNIWNYETINLRDFGIDKHGTVDDTPYGGGAGMVMRADVLGPAIEHAMNGSINSKIIYFSPRGKLLTQAKVEEYSKENNLILLCGRFEGIDQRVIDEYNIEELSIGDYILSGGEIAAFTFMDSCIRLLPGVLNNQDTHLEESFATNSAYANLLEYPHYTRPNVWKERFVPEVLLSGHHGDIYKWRLREAEKITETRRTDLWEKYQALKKNAENDKK
jgi:tRNA (guanine37-N1)-methyltransferase